MEKVLPEQQTWGFWRWEGGLLGGREGEIRQSSIFACPSGELEATPAAEPILGPRLVYSS